jgi:uncharacterized membrane protein
LSPRDDALNRVLARVLEIGTWIASALIAVGMAMLPRTTIVLAGLALFIFLPVLRVLVMFAAFTRRRDGWGMAIAALVLTIILFGVVVGVAG